MYLSLRARRQRAVSKQVNGRELLLPERRSDGDGDGGAAAPVGEDAAALGRRRARERADRRLAVLGGVEGGVVGGALVLMRRRRARAGEFVTSVARATVRSRRCVLSLNLVCWLRALALFLLLEDMCLIEGL